MTITAEQIFLLNSKMGSIARKVQLGTLIANAESITEGEIAIADGKILIGSAGGVGAAKTLSGDVTTDRDGVTAIGALKVTEAMLKASSTVGLGVRRRAYCVFDPTGVVGDRTQAAHALAAIIPDKAFVTGFWYWVETTFTSAADSATVALHIQAANDCLTAIAISDVSNVLDSTTKPVEGTPVVETTSSWLATSAARAITATVGVQALTGGKMHIWADYMVYG